MTLKPFAFISLLEFSSGQKIQLEKNDKIVLVGPNNSGKSQSLREIIKICEKGEDETSKVIKKIEIEKNGTTNQLREFLEKEGENQTDLYIYKNWAIAKHSLPHWSQEYLKGGISQGFIKNINADDRLKICEKQRSITPQQQKSKPQHVLYDNSSLMEKVSGLFRKAFGFDIMFDYRGGSVMPIHVGEKPNPNIVDRVSDEYVAKIRKNPLLDQQGDGMKSYAGILFETIVSDLDINLLDEPEAFLHPPQMRRLGETLASEVPGQLIVATHSSDIMRGFLEGTEGKVRVLRIRRKQSKNIVSEASPETISELWSRPDLRYSNALEGIFHEQTILCEDDSDCRLFNATADYLASNDTEPWQDTAYVPTGGKHGVKKIAEILRKIGVPIKAVFDIDFLSEKELIKSTVEAFGGEWDQFDNLWRIIKSAITSGTPPKSMEDIKSEIEEYIKKPETTQVSKAEINRIISQKSPWNDVKNNGKSAIPSGDATIKYNELIRKLEEIGIYIVNVGEVENFCKEIGNHGPKFVTTLLKDIQIGDERLKDLRDFVKKIHKGNHAPLDD